jgi:hypothetical protein
MTLHVTHIEAFVDKRLKDMCVAPPMWGSPDAVELLALTLLEIEALVKFPDLDSPTHYVIDAYKAEILRRYPKVPGPLRDINRAFHEFNAGTKPTYGEELFDVFQALRKQLF